MLLGLVDVYMVGRISPHAIGAAALGNLWVYGTLIFALGLVFGMDSEISQAHGRRDASALGLALQRSIVFALACSVPLAGVWWAAGPMLELLGQEPSLCADAAVYVRAQIFSAPFFLVFVSLRQYLTCRGLALAAMWVPVVANVVNVIFNEVLIFGRFGLPAMGLEGAGLATGLTRVFMLGATFALVRAWKLTDGGWVSLDAARDRVDWLRRRRSTWPSRLAPFRL